MVLFIYVASLAANELIYFYKTPFVIGASFGLRLLRRITIINFYDKEIILINKLDYSGLFELYGGANYFLMLFLGCYLLLTLIGVVKVIQLHEGPLRRTV